VEADGVHADAAGLRPTRPSQADRDPAAATGIHPGYAHTATVTYLVRPGRFLRRCPARLSRDGLLSR
jgi:hypothetical protein